MFYLLLLFMMLEGHAAVTPKSVVTILRVVFDFHYDVVSMRIFCIVLRFTT